MKRILIWVLKGFFLISWILLFGYFYFSYLGPLGPIISDVSKRLEAPDHTKTALLIRRKAFDLNFWSRLNLDGKRQLSTNHRTTIRIRPSTGTSAFNGQTILRCWFSAPMKFHHISNPEHGPMIFGTELQSQSQRVYLRFSRRET